MSMEVEYLIEQLQKKAERGELLYIGESLNRVDDIEKILGKPLYTADILPKQTLYAKLVHSTIPHGYIRSINAANALNNSKVKAVLTYRDVPGINESSAVIPDRPLFADRKVRSTGDIVAAVLADDFRAATEASQDIKIEYDPLKPIFDPLEAMKEGAPLIHDAGNVAKHMKVYKGDVQKGFEASDIIVEGTYSTQFQDATPMEPELAYAVPKENGNILIVGSMQSPHITQSGVAKTLNLPLSRVEVIQAVTGGAFGPKSDETPTDLGAIAAIGALKTGRPVFVNMTREDSMIMHTKRHPSITRLKTGATADGKLIASQAEMIMETGAYASLGVLVIVRAMFHANGAYEIPNVKNDGYLVYTNNTFAGSFRGFGAPQAFFASESQMDELAKKLNMDPLDLRLINMLRPGKRTSTNQLMDAACGLPECVEQVVAASNYRKKVKEYAEQKGNTRRGVGIAILHHGNALGPEGNDYVYVHLNVDRDGIVYLGTGLTEYGTGAISGLAQIASSIMGCKLDRFRIDRPNSLKHKESGPTVASRTTAIGGNGARDAAEKLRDRLNIVAAKLLDCMTSEVVIVDDIAYSSSAPQKRVGWNEIVDEAYRSGVSLNTIGYYMAPRCIWDEHTGLGSPYSQFTFGAAVADVEVDIDTGVYSVKSYYVAFDVGRAVNPRNVKGQLYGGTVQGLGYATMEELVHKDGRVLNPNLKDYYIPTSLDIPEEFVPIIVEKGGAIGPFGAKVVAEPPIVLPGPAVRNAILNATGWSVDSLPITAEKVWREGHK